MKKTGLIAIIVIALMSCNGGANDGNPNTDTTTFPSETPVPTANDTTGSGSAPDTSDRAPSSVGSNSTAPASRSSTPGNRGGKGDSSMSRPQ